MLLSEDVRERFYSASLSEQNGECCPSPAEEETNIDYLEFTPGSKWEDRQHGNPKLLKSIQHALTRSCGNGTLGGPTPSQGKDGWLSGSEPSLHPYPQSLAALAG